LNIPSPEIWTIGIIIPEIWTIGIIIPEIWTIGIIMPIYKNKGDPGNPDSYRGITLNNIYIYISISTCKQKILSVVEYPTLNPA
jgi:hypothetical protein